MDITILFLAYVVPTIIALSCMITMSKAKGVITVGDVLMIFFVGLMPIINIMACLVAVGQVVNRYESVVVWKRK